MWKHEEISKYIKNDQQYLAHINNERKETLKQHSDLVFSYFQKMIQEKQLDAVFSNFSQKLAFQDQNSDQCFRDLINNLIYFHDFGKINKAFQSNRLGQNQFKDKMQAVLVPKTQHAIYSSVIYFWEMWQKIRQIQTNDKSKLQLLVILNAYIISRHHGDLENGCYIKDNEEFSSFAEKMENAICIMKEYPEQFDNYFAEKKVAKGKIEKLINSWLQKLTENELSTDFYDAYIRMLFSMLVSADFYATTEFMFNEKTTNFSVIQDATLYRDAIEKTPVYHSIRKHQTEKYLQESDINKLRSELFVEVEDELLQNLDGHIFYLEAPTGSGKTNMSINLALKLIEKTSANKVFYTFPFNALIEQTKMSLEKVFETIPDFEKHLGIVNSLTTFDYENEKENQPLRELDYALLLQKRQFLHYPFVLTTHVNLFAYLFGRSREQHFPFWQLANSVLILDEIQSYRNDIWTEIIYFLDKYAKILNIKIIIMSATLPDLGVLIDKNTEYIRLNKKAYEYTKHPLFKDRVTLDNTLIAKTQHEKVEQVFPILKNKLCDGLIENNNKILIEFLYKKNALNFYKYLREELNDLDYQIEVMTGDDNLNERKRIIELTKEDIKLILIATQVVEAGVDIDMDIGIKQVSLFDSEEQFAGRINRSAKKQNATVFFFAIAEKLVNKKDFRAKENFRITNSEIFKMLQNKNFTEYYHLILEQIKVNRARYNEENFEKFVQKQVSRLDFKTIEEKMKLIDEREEFTLVLAKSNETEIVQKLWHQMEEKMTLRIEHKITYAQWRVELTNIYATLNKYSYRISKERNRSLNISYEKCFGDMYLILNADQYFENGKFMREDLNEALTSTSEII